MTIKKVIFKKDSKLDYYYNALIEDIHNPNELKTIGFIFKKSDNTFDIHIEEKGKWLITNKKSLLSAKKILVNQYNSIIENHQYHLQSLFPTSKIKEIQYEI